MSKRKVIEGSKIHDWTVISHEYSKNGIAFYKCKCECGIEQLVRGCNLRSNRSKGCRKCGLERTRQSLLGKDKSKFDPITYTIKRIMKDYKYRAKKKGFEFTLSLKVFTNMISKNCFYCNIEPSTITNRTNEAGVLQIRQERYDAGWVRYNGIDRIDSSKGYTVENTVPCCPTCNTAKMELSMTEFHEWIKRVYTHFINKSCYTPLIAEVDKKGKIYETI